MFVFVCVCVCVCVCVSDAMLAPAAVTVTTEQLQQAPLERGSSTSTMLSTGSPYQSSNESAAVSPWQKAVRARPVSVSARACVRGRV